MRQPTSNAAIDEPTPLGLGGVASARASETRRGGAGGGDDTLTLTQAASKGDDDAFATLYRRWFGFCLSSASRLTRRDESFCLDVVQDAMLRVARTLKPMPTEGDLARWLHTVVRTAAIDRIRADARRAARETARELLRAAESIGSSDHAAAHASARAAARDALDLLETLSPDDRDLLRLRFQAGLSSSAISELRGVTPGSVAGRVRRALLKLRAQLRDPMFESAFGTETTSRSERSGPVGDGSRTCSLDASREEETP